MRRFIFPASEVRRWMGLFIYRFFVPRAVQAKVLLWSDSGVVLLRALDEGWALPLFFLPVTASGCCDGSRRWPGGRSRDRPGDGLRCSGRQCGLLPAMLFVR